MLKEITKQEALKGIAEDEIIYMIRDFAAEGEEPEEMSVINLTSEIKAYMEGNDNRFLADGEPAGPKEDAEDREEPCADPSEPKEAAPDPAERETVDKASTPSPEAAPENEPEKTKPEGGKKELNVGKVMALHRAGWPQAKIADEMGVAQSTIWRTLDKMARMGRQNDVAANRTDR